MKKFWLRALFTVIVVLFVLTLVPSTILAQNASMKIDVGRPGEASTFYLSATEIMAKIGILELLNLKAVLRNT